MGICDPPKPGPLPASFHRNKLSDSVRELVRFYEEIGDLKVDEYVARYVNCTEFRNARFDVVGQPEPRYAALSCDDWRHLFTELRLNQVYLGDYLTNNAVAVIQRVGGVPKELQTRSEVFVFGEYQELPACTAAPGRTYRQYGLPTASDPHNHIGDTFVHKAQVTINWRQDPTDGEWKIVQFRQLLLQRWWSDSTGGPSDAPSPVKWFPEQILFSGRSAPVCE